LKADFEETILRVIGEAGDLSDSVINDAIINDKDIAGDRLPDQIRGLVYDRVLSSNDPRIERAMRSGAIAGEVEFNVALVLATALDPALVANDVGLATDTLRLGGATRSAVSVARSGEIADVATLALEVGDPTAAWNQVLFRNAAKATPYRDFYDVVGHGDAFKIGIMESDAPLDAKQLAARMLSKDDYRPGQPVRLIVCWAGAPEQGGLAESLARELYARTGFNTVTIGATGPVAPLDDGRVVLAIPHAPRRVPGPVRWRFFDSNGPLMDTIDRKLP
jgi:hypothetical protein